MESSQVEQLLAYLNSQNVKVKNEALGIVLQLTGTKDARAMLRKPEVTKQLLRSVPVAETSQNALSVLLNFSQDIIFAEEIIELNGIQRIIDNLKESLIEYSKLDIKTFENEKEKKAKEEHLLTVIQLQLLLLSNLSQNDEVKKRILEHNREPDFHGLNFSFMLSWFNHPTISPTFHFFANIAANVSATKETREFIMQPKIQLLENIITSIFSVEPNRRMGIIRTIRNCVFEYEEEKTLEYLLSPKVDLWNSVLKCMLFNVTRSLASDPDCDKELDEAKELGKKYNIILEKEDESVNMHQVLEEVDLLIDILLVATNIDQEKHKLQFDADLLRFIISNAKLVFHSESLRDKLDVISVQLLAENPM